MRILVTGATGFIGNRLVPRLVEEGHAVVAAGRDHSRLAQLAGAEPVVADLRDAHAADAFPRRVDAVVHLAQGNTESELFAVNAHATGALLEYALVAGAGSFVLASSGSVYGGADRLLTEEDPVQPLDEYGRSKVAAEQLVSDRAGAIRTCIVRLFAPYGPGQRGRVIPKLVANVRSGKPVVLHGSGRPRLTPIYIDHVVDVIAPAVVSDESMLLNVAGEEILSIRNMAETIGRVLGIEPRFEESAEAGRQDLIGDATQMRRRFRLPDPLVSFEQGVEAISALARA
jgi:nucleoside-diphosphate-sugar epimerase